MDKYEYKVRAEEIKALIARGEFAEAVKIADTIDWHRVKSVMMLCTISDLYKINRRFQESKDILLMAYERHPGGRLIVYSLCELSIKMGEFVQAIEYYKEFVQIAPKDTGRYILQYKLYEAQDVSLEERIAVLEEFKKRDYREKWAYELAYLYHRVGLETKCVEECDEMILWFGEGRYVLKALELKQLHQPLNEAQQEKYIQIKQGMERPPEEPEEEEEVAQEEEPEETEESEEAEETDTEEALGEETAGYVPKVKEEAGPEEDFKVKTVDLGQYNTINLQKELAESMKEILGDGRHEQSEKDSLEPIVESIVAPLLQETGDILPGIQEPPRQALQIGELEFVELDEAEEEEEPETAVEEPEEQVLPPKQQESRIAMEEVFFEEDIKDILQQDTKRINLGDTKEIVPGKKMVYPVTLPSRFAMTEQNVPPYQIVEQQEPDEPDAPVGMPETIQAQPNLLKPHKPSGFEQMLSQEYDGQISFVVPNKDKVEKQITGQMNIADIMAEWERMKRANEEKRREDVRKRVEQHTGNMFSEFDEAAKREVSDGLMLSGEDTGINAADTEAAETGSSDKRKPEKALKTETGEKLPVESVPEEAGEDLPEEIIAAEENIAIEESIAEKDGGTAENVPTEEIKEQDGIKAEAEDVEKAAKAEEGGDKKAEKSVQEMKAAVHEEHKPRSFTAEEKELFGRFAHNRKAKEQILHAIEEMNMDSYNGNVIVTGEEEAGTLDLAKNLVRMMQLTDRNFSGKVAKISGETLNKKDVPVTLSKLSDGALIIEHATGMSSGTATDLNKALAKENRGIFVIMEGKKDEMNIFLRKNRALMDNFNARIDIESLDDQALVEYARQYADEMEYSIDELGILALHTRIADMQTSDHEVTVAEVKELVDDAIYFADKKNPRHFFDILFGKRYDAEDMIILREKDFMHY